MPSYFYMSTEFCFRALMEFKRINKRQFYAACYSNHEATIIANDFHAMYLMGGEL